MGAIAALGQGLTAFHPFVEGELLLAGANVGALLAGSRRLPMEEHGELRAWVAELPKPVRGVGWVDAHPAYSALVHRCALLTLDRPLAALHDACLEGRGR